jgi:hypothetical protein
MAKPENKAALLLAIGGKLKGKGAMMSEPDDDETGGESDKDGDEPSVEDAKRSAAEDALAAFKSGDADALSSALSDFVAACNSEDY